MKRILFILLPFILVSIFTLPGCWDRQELDTLGLVQVLGLDLTKDERQISATVVIPIPSQLQAGGGGEGGGGGGEEPVLVITKEAPTIYESFNLINTSVNREITLLQNTVIIIGEDLAKKGIKPWMDQLVRFRAMRRNTLFFVCRGKAAEILKIKPKLEKNPSEFFTSLTNLSKRTGMFPVTTVNDFLIHYELKPLAPYAPIISPFESKEGEKPPQGAGKQPKDEEAGGAKEETPPPKPEIRAVGTAAFKNDRMVGTLDLYESQILQLITGQFREAMLTVVDPKKDDNYIAIRLLAAAPVKTRYRRPEGEDHLTVSLDLEADILSIQSGIDYTRPDLELFLGRHIAQEIKKRTQKVVQRVQQDFRTDIFGFGLKARRSFLTTQSWEEYNWPERFPEVKISSVVNVAIRRVGVQFRPPSLR